MLRDVSVIYSPGFRWPLSSQPAHSAIKGGIMKSIRILMSLSACLLIQSGVTLAQGVGSSGNITGTVTDSSGAVITNAIVTAIDPQRGIKRTSSSDRTGRFEIPGLPPTAYSVS